MGQRSKQRLYWRMSSAAFLLSMLGLSLAVSLPPARAETYMEALMRGRRLEAGGDQEGALNAFVLAKSLISGQATDIEADARMYLARLYTKMGRYGEADSEYQSMFAYSREPTLKAEYGQFLMDQGKFSSAMSVWSDILAQNPSDPEALYGMGLALEGGGNIDSARDYYQKVISVAPASMQARSASGKMNRLGNAVEARQSAKFFPVDPELGAAGLGWWNLQKMPIHVYIDEGSGVKGFRSEMKNAVYRAMDAWRQASGGKITFVTDAPDPANEEKWKEIFGKNVDPLRKVSSNHDLPDDPVKTGIHVHWAESLGGIALGLAWTNPYAGKVDQQGRKISVISSGHLWLATNCLADASPLPKISAANQAILEKQDRIISEVAVHEFGHTLGLVHSPNSKDIMCSGIFSLNSTDLVEGRSLSSGDLASLAEHYNNFEGTGVPAASTAGVEPLPVRTSRGKGSSAVNTELEAPENSKTASAMPQSTPAAQNTRSRLDMQDALFEINSKHYELGVSKLERILSLEPGNLQARYLRAVANVMLHRYAEAEKDYSSIIAAAPGSELAKRAGLGLAKIKR